MVSRYITKPELAAREQTVFTIINKRGDKH